jgi:hypothetical protein
MHLPELLSQFSALARVRVSDAGNEEASQSVNIAAMVLPGGIYSHASYVKVYATCRLRRIWFSEIRMADRGHDEQRMPWEFELCAEC